MGVKKKRKKNRKTNEHEDDTDLPTILRGHRYFFRVFVEHRFRLNSEFPAKLRAPCNSNRDGEGKEIWRGKKKEKEKEEKGEKKKGGEGDPLSGGREWKNSTSAGGDLCRILLDVEF